MLAWHWNWKFPVRFSHTLSILMLLALAPLARAFAAPAVAPAPAGPPPVLTVEVHGDHVELDDEQKTLAVHGNVTITAATDRPGYPTVSLAAEQLEGDLKSGRLIATQGVKLRSQQLSLVGRRVDLDFKNDAFTLDQGAMEVDLPSPQSAGRILRGFFFGNSIGRDGSVLYVIHGRLTTCDRANPHYFIGSNKVSFDTATGRLDVYGGTLQLYGVKLRLPGHYHHIFAPSVGPVPLKVPLPGYSSFDGLYTDLPHEFLSPESNWRVTGTLRVGTEMQFPASLVAAHGDEDSIFTLRATRLEEVVWNLRDRSRIFRLPEVSYVRELQPTSSGLPRLEFTAFADYIHEHVQTRDDVPMIAAARAGVVLDYTPYPWQRRNRRGVWWAASGRQTVYNTGEALSDLAVELGTGWYFGENLSASLSETHHFTSGSTPFFFDKVWVQDELVGTLGTRLATNWRLDATGRWDLSAGELRDYDVMLSHRVHCLTWKAGYSLGADMFTLGLDLNGITGGTPPPVTNPLVAPGEVPPLPAPVPGNAATTPSFQIVP